MLENVNPEPTGERMVNSRDRAGKRWPRDVALILAPLLARFAVMTACAAALYYIAFCFADTFLPVPNSIYAGIVAFCQVLTICGMAGIALGTLLTHPLGRGKPSVKTRRWQALIAALPLLISLLIVDSVVYFGL